MSKGERIKHLREKVGKSQTAFADAIGVSKQTLFKYENDIITNVPTDKIEAIAKLANVSPGYVMGWEPEYHVSDFKPLGNPDEKDIELLKAYHSSSEETQAIICRILGIERRE